MWSELSEVRDSQSIVSLSLSLSPRLCFLLLTRPLLTVMEVRCGQELRMDNQAAAVPTIITAAHISLSLSLFPGLYSAAILLLPLSLSPIYSAEH